MGLNMKYKNSRKECWEELTKNVKVRLDGKYVIDAETYHGVKSMLLSLADKPKKHAYFTSPIFKEDLLNINCPSCKRKIKNGVCSHCGWLQGAISPSVPLPPLNTKPEIEKMGIETLIEPFDKIVPQGTVNSYFRDKINELVERVNYLSTKDKEDGK